MLGSSLAVLIFGGVAAANGLQPRWHWNTTVYVRSNWVHQPKLYPKPNIAAHINIALPLARIRGTQELLESYFNILANFLKLWSHRHWNPDLDYIHDFDYGEKPFH